jgi:hypothetical protein
MVLTEFLSNGSVVDGSFSTLIKRPQEHLSVAGWDGPFRAAGASAEGISEDMTDGQRELGFPRRQTLGTRRITVHPDGPPLTIAQKAAHAVTRPAPKLS